MKYKIVDPNLPERNREVAFTPFVDVAEILAAGYAEARYGGRVERALAKDLRPIRVVDTETDEILLRIGVVHRPRIGRLRKQGHAEYESGGD